MPVPRTTSVFDCFIIKNHSPGIPLCTAKLFQFEGGFFLIFAGLILILVMKSAYKDTETGVRYQKKERFFQQAMNAPISSALASKPDSVDLSEEDKGNAVRLDIYFSKTLGKAYLQLFEYVPYKYEPCSKIYEYGIENVQKLIK